MGQVRKRGEKTGAGSGHRQGFLAVAALLLALALLYLVTSLSTYSNSLSAANRELSGIEVTGARFDAASWGLVQIMRNDAANTTYKVNSTQDGFNLSLTIPLPYTSNYAQDVSRWQIFAQAFDAPANVTLNITEAIRPTIYVRPQNITIDYQPGRTFVTPLNSAGSSGQVTGYDTLVRLNDNVGRIVWINSSTIAASDPSALYFHLSAQGTNGTASSTAYLNRSAYSEVRLFNTFNQTIMDMQLNATAALRTYYDPTLNGSMTSVLYLNASSAPELGTNVINAAYQAQKIGPAQIR